MWIDDSGEFAVRMMDFPGDILASVDLTKDGSDFANFYINDWLAPAAKQKAFDHEMKHLRRDDFRNDRTIEEVEEEGAGG